MKVEIGRYEIESYSDDGKVSISKTGDWIDGEVEFSIMETHYQSNIRYVTMRTGGYLTDEAEKADETWSRKFEGGRILSQILGGGPEASALAGFFPEECRALADSAIETLQIYAPEGS